MKDIIRNMKEGNPVSDDLVKAYGQFDYEQRVLLGGVLSALEQSSSFSVAGKEYTVGDLGNNLRDLPIGEVMRLNVALLNDLEEDSPHLMKSIGKAVLNYVERGVVDVEGKN